MKDSKARLFRTLVLLGTVILMGLIFAFRYDPAFSMSNFYAEDGMVFIYNIFQDNILGATFTAFNGYFVVGQYIVASLAFIPYVIFNLPFTSLPLLVAIMSCLFLGLTASLPLLLFRRELGWIPGLVCAVLIAFTPMPGSDFAIIGTLGNLKFAFLFWAVLFIIYRNIHYLNKRKVVWIDAILLLCVLTNGPVIVLLPFIAWPYRNDIIKAFKKRYIAKSFLLRRDVLSALALLAVSFLYVLVVYIKGIPVMPNYLDAPYIWEATDNISYRVTMYTWFFAIAKETTDKLAILLCLIMLVSVFVINKHGRKVFAFGLFAIAVATISFVATRTGVSEFMLGYEKTPDQFFYAQTMVFAFISVWIVAPYIKGWKRQGIFAGAAVLFIIVTATYGSSFGKNSELYKNRGDIFTNIEKVCQNHKQEEVKVPVYPGEPWAMKLDREVVCE